MLCMLAHMHLCVCMYIVIVVILSLSYMLNILKICLISPRPPVACRYVTTNDVTTRRTGGKVSSALHSTRGVQLGDATLGPEDEDEGVGEGRGGGRRGRRWGLGGGGREVVKPLPHDAFCKGCDGEKQQLVHTA